MFNKHNQYPTIKSRNARTKRPAQVVGLRQYRHSAPNVKPVLTFEIEGNSDVQEYNKYIVEVLGFDDKHFHLVLLALLWYYINVNLSH